MAAGQDQAVTGQAYDTISVRVIDPKSIGIEINEQTRTVSDDGNTLTIKVTAIRRTAISR